MNKTERSLICSLARRKYIESGKTKNISLAVRLYLSEDTDPPNLADFKSDDDHLTPLRLALAKNRPICLECDNEMYVKFNVHDKLGKPYPSALFCKRCGMIYYLNETIEELTRSLSK